MKKCSKFCAVQPASGQVYRYKKTKLKSLGAKYESDHWLGRRNARNQVENWVGELINRVRDGKVNPPKIPHYIDSPGTVI
jgi:hypothetical protein